MLSNNSLRDFVVNRDRERRPPIVSIPPALTWLGITY